jgi:hypothetical protein
MNGAVNSTATKQRRVSGVYERVDVLAGDVAYSQNNSSTQECFFMFRVQASACASDSHPKG